MGIGVEQGAEQEVTVWVTLSRDGEKLVTSGLEMC